MITGLNLVPMVVEQTSRGERAYRHINLHALRGRIDVIPRDWNEPLRMLGFPER